MKRFYKDVAVAPAADGAFGVTLDGRPIKTPQSRTLEVPTEALAQAISAEWAGVEDDIKPLEMPMTRLGNTAVDRGGALRESVASEILAFGETDLLCYRASRPERLVALQAAAWDPVLAWLKERVGARFTVTNSVLAVPQSPETLAALATFLPDQNAFLLTGLHALTTLSGSIALSYAIYGGFLSPRDAWQASVLDEVFQSKAWGEDAEALAARETKMTEFLASAKFLHHITP